MLWSLGGIVLFKVLEIVELSLYEYFKLEALQWMRKIVLCFINI